MSNPIPPQSSQIPPDPAPPPLPNIPPEPKKHDTDHLLGYFQQNSREIIAYVLLILGIILLFFDALYGGILVGLVAGIYFGEELIDYFVRWNEGMHKHGVARYLICAGVAVAFFISAPAIFLGAAVAVGLRQLFVEQKR
jgi:hypothetical protein